MSKLQYLLEIGKRKKFDISNELKEIFDNMAKITKDIKRLTIERGSIQKIEEIKIKSE